MLESLLHLIFPPHCPSCGRVVKIRGGWCAPCLSREMHPHRPALSPELVKMVRSAWAMGGYHGTVGKLIRNLKYHKRKDLLPAMHFFLAEASKDLDFSVDLAVPVPLFEKRERERGFNQAELLFVPELARRGVPMENLLLRQRHTDALYGLSPRERREELRGSFALAGGCGEVRGKSILLVDDILTTGATLELCSRILLEAGALEISILVYADANA